MINWSIFSRLEITCCPTGSNFFGYFCRFKTEQRRHFVPCQIGIKICNIHKRENVTFSEKGIRILALLSQERLFHRYDFSHLSSTPTKTLYFIFQFQINGGTFVSLGYQNHSL